MGGDGENELSLEDNNVDPHCAFTSAASGLKDAAPQGAHLGGMLCLEDGHPTSPMSTLHPLATDTPIANSLAMANAGCTLSMSPTCLGVPTQCQKLARTLAS